MSNIIYNGSFEVEHQAAVDLASSGNTNAAEIQLEGLMARCDGIYGPDYATSQAHRARLQRDLGFCIGRSITRLAAMTVGGVTEQDSILDRFKTASGWLDSSASALNDLFMSPSLESDSPHLHSELGATFLARARLNLVLGVFAADAADKQAYRRRARDAFGQAEEHIAQGPNRYYGTSLYGNRARLEIISGRNSRHYIRKMWGPSDPRLS